MTGPMVSPVLDRFASWRREHPEAPAVVADGVTHGYAELDALARRHARALRAAGAGRETVVALVADRGPGYVAMVLGVLLAGAAFVPVEPGVPVRRARRMCRRGGAGPARRARARGVRRRGRGGVRPAAERARRRGGARGAGPGSGCGHCAGPAARRSRVRDLHVRIHRHAQGRDGRRRRHGQPPGGQDRGPGARPRRRRRPHRAALLRHLRVADPRRPDGRRPDRGGLAPQHLRARRTRGVGPPAWRDRAGDCPVLPHRAHRAARRRPEGRAVLPAVPRGHREALPGRSPSAGTSTARTSRSSTPTARPSAPTTSPTTW